MKKFMKWLVIISVSLMLMMMAALVIIPLFVDLNAYKPQIEKQVSEATGRPFSIGGSLKLSLFPWAGLSFSDVRLGNPSGFEEKDFVTVKSFDVSVKLIPLFFKDIQVKTFMLKDPHIVLETTQTGKVNWFFPQKPSQLPEAEPEEEKPVPDRGFALKSLKVENFAIENGAVLWIDHRAQQRKELSAINLKLDNVSLDQPIGIAFSLLIENNPVVISGTAGPLGTRIGAGTIPYDLTLKIFKELAVKVKGSLDNLVTEPRFEAKLAVDPFSPRKLVSASGQKFPLVTADPNALNTVALEATIKGNRSAVEIPSAAIIMDESTIDMSFRAEDFSKPSITFKVSMDSVDVDRYLPPKTEKQEQDVKPSSSASQKKIDYTPLRRLSLKGIVDINKIKIQNAQINTIKAAISGEKGIFNLNPLSAELYNGSLKTTATLNVQGNIPKITADIESKRIHLAPLLHDVVRNDWLEGSFQALIHIGTDGERPEMIKQTLNGKGEIVIDNGAIQGIDLAGMVRNIGTTFGIGDKGTERPRTDFSEFRIPFTITNGVVDTQQTSLLSPFIRLQAQGKADLNRETLDFRIEPKFVATIKGQGDTMERSGLMVPVLVTGSFTSPRFQPDLKGILQQKIEEGTLKPPEALKDITITDDKKSLQDQAKDILKAIPLKR